MFNKQHEMCFPVMPNQNVLDIHLFLVYITTGFGLGSLSAVVGASPLFM